MLTLMLILLLIAVQVISAMKIIMGEDGTDIGRTKLRSLRENANYFRKRMGEMGCHVLGTYDSPVVPVMLYNISKIAGFSRECLKRGVRSMRATMMDDMACCAVDMLDACDGMPVFTLMCPFHLSVGRRCRWFPRLSSPPRTCSFLYLCRPHTRRSG